MVRLDKTNAMKGKSDMARVSEKIVASFACAFCIAAQADIYVDAAAAPGGDGTQTRPYATIQEAVDNASASNVIRVTAGVYTNGMKQVQNKSYARVHVNGLKGLRIVGAGRGKSFIVGSRNPATETYDDTMSETRTNLVRCVYANNSDGMIIEGFTLRDGETFYGDTSSGNTSGGALCADSTEVYLVDCDIIHCCARVGGAMNYGTAVRCFIEGNYGMSGAVGRNARLVNSILSRNRDPSANGTLYGGSFYNCTVFGNAMDGNGYVMADGAAYNCIVALSSKTEYGAEMKASMRTVENNVLASTATCGYRQFLAPAVDDYRLLAGADAVGAGRASHLSSLEFPAGLDPMVDFAGNPIVADGDGRINAGAVQGKVTPAGGALAFVSGAYEIDGHTNANTFATYVYPEMYPTQYCVRAVLGEEDHLYRVERYAPETGGLKREYPAAVPYRDGTMWMMPPVDSSVYLTNKAIVASAVYWVDPEHGSDSNSGTSDAEPFATVSNAVVTAGKNKATVIYLMPGEYTNEVVAAATAARGNFRISIPDKSRLLRIVSTDGPERTIIRGRADSAYVSGQGPAALKGVILFANTILQGVTIADCYTGSGGGSANYGAAVFIDSTDVATAPPQLIDCVITNCHANSGVVYNYGVIRRCRFVDSSTDSQFAVYDGASTKYGMPLFSCYMRGVANDISTSSSKNGIIGGSARVYQCTFTGSLDSGRLTGGGNVSWNTIWYGGANVYDTSVFTNCFVYNPSGAANGVYEKTNPQFADAASSGMLCANSPAIGAGLVPTIDDIGDAYCKLACGDIDGNPLVFTDGKPTLGAFQTPATVVRVTVNEPSDGGWAMSSGEYGSFDVVEGSSLNIVPAGGSRPCIGVTCAGVDYLFTNAPNETVSLGYEALLSGGVDVAIAGIYTNIWYVDDDGDDDASGFLPTHPKKTLCAAAALLSSGDTLLVFPGVYADGSAFHAVDSVASRIVVKEGTKVVSLEGPEHTVIMGAAASDIYATNEYGNGTNAVRCAYLAKNSRLDGFTLVGGRTYTNATGTAALSYGAAAAGAGRGMGAVVANCIVSNNVGYCGTLYKVDAFSSLVVGNIAFNGGSGLREANGYGCCFRGNTGNPVVTYASDLYECTLANDNTTVSGSGSASLVGSLPSGSVNFFNTLFMGTISLNSDKVTVSNCVCATGSTFGDGTTVTGDVAIVDFSTQSFRDCVVPVAGANVAVDAANESLCTNAFSTSDLRGFQREMNGRRDIGAYEADWRPVYAAILGSTGWLTVTNAGPNVIAGDECVILADGLLRVRLSNASVMSCLYSVPMRVMGGGVLTVALDDDIVEAVTAADGERTLELEIAAPKSVLSFMYAPSENDSGNAVVGRFSRVRDTGFIFIVR